MRRLAGGERSTRFESTSQLLPTPSPGETKSQDQGKLGGEVKPKGRTSLGRWNGVI
jgi:hypothetical protein